MAPVDIILTIDYISRCECDFGLAFLKVFQAALDRFQNFVDATKLETISKLDGSKMESVRRPFIQTMRGKHSTIMNQENDLNSMSFVVFVILITIK